MTNQSILRPLAPRWRNGPARLDGDAIVMDAARGADYEPLSNPKIGLEFTRIRDAADVERFVTKYGQLTHGHVGIDVVWGASRASVKSVLDAAATLNHYLTTMLDVRRADKGDQDAMLRLRDQFTGAGAPRQVPAEWYPPGEQIADTDDRTLLIHLSEWVSWQLSIGLKAARIFVFDRAARGESVPPGNLRVCVLPRTLLDVCYMQIATVLADREPVEVCPECRRVFVMEDGRQKFCTPKCASRFRFNKHKMSPAYKQRRRAYPGRSAPSP